MWALLALTAAVATASREALVKSVMRDGDELAVTLLIAAATTAALLPALALTAPALPARPFYGALLVSGAINAVAAVAIARALHVSDLSLVSPLQSTTPVFMVATGWLILREVPSVTGLAGIVVIGLGAWVLNVQEGRVALTAPLVRLARDLGARLFLAVAAMYAISGAVDKVGVAASTPLVWTCAVNGFVALALLPAAVLRGGRRRVRAVAGAAPRRIALAGVIMAIGLTAQMSALPLTLAAYVIAVKRTSVLFSVLAGALVFRERALAPRLGGAVIMLAGFLLLTL